MNSAEGAGRTVEDAVEFALRVMGASRDDVTIEVLQEPRPALLGFGGREARVRLTRRPVAQDAAREIVAAALVHMGVSATLDVRTDGEGVHVAIAGPDAAGVIGHHGRTLDAMELLVALRVQRAAGRRIPVVVDVAGYRVRRESALTEQAQRTAERVAREGRRVALEPMTARERRIIHLALRDHAEVSTMSEGEDDHRHVVVVPRGEALARPEAERDDTAQDE